MKETENFFKRKKVTAGFAAVSLIFGFLFMKSSTTGNVVLNNRYSLSPLSFVGLLLVACAVVLAAYSIKK